MITAIFDVGDDLPDETYGFLDFGANVAAHSLVSAILRQVQDTQARQRVLVQAITDAVGLYLVIDAIQFELQAQGADRNLDDAALAQARTICLAKIDVAAREGRLKGKKLGNYLRAWYSYGGREAAKQFAVNLARTPRWALDLVRGFVYEAKTMPATSAVYQRVWELNLETIGQFVSVDDLKNVLQAIVADAPQPEARALMEEYAPEVSAFRRAISKPSEADV
jgi:hypothetical protein